MSELTTEKLASRIVDANLLDAHQIDTIFAELGTREIPLPVFTAALMRKGLITNFQLERLMKGRTTFVVAHRLSTIRNADRIVAMRAGRIEEIGSHDELLRTGGLYSQLHARQSGGRLEL